MITAAGFAQELATPIELSALQTCVGGFIKFINIDIVDGRPQYIDTIEVARPVQYGVGLLADDPRNAQRFGRNQYLLTANGQIDQSKLTDAQHLELRKTREGHRTLGLE